jgi:N-acetyl-gamma-glutamyl-phosphate reductase
MRIKVGIIGGAGYTAGELLRILLFHPFAEIVFIHSNSNAGNKISSIHQDLTGDTDMVFTDRLDFSAVDVIFLCLGHGKSVEFMQENEIPEKVRVIDLSQDFRLQPSFSKGKITREFIYGLPELFRADIQKAWNIANPGCFATAFQLALLPLAANGLLKHAVNIHGITGSTGAGQSLSQTSHFSWRNNNISVYKAFTHQHLKEVRKSLESVSVSDVPALRFIPVRGDFARGIFLTAYTQCDESLESVLSVYRDFYKEAAFTFISDLPVHMKQVINTNKCLLQIEKSEDQILITSVIDNLTKGASGQAVQNLNLMFGLDEKTGLRLKPVMF